MTAPARSVTPIHCALPASLAPGATWTISVPYGVGSGIAAQTVTNTATATSDENPGGVSAVDATDVTASADLGVTVSDGLSSVTAGDGVAHGYLITVSNAGPSDASGVTLTDTWPTGFSQGALSPSQGTCAPIGAGPDFGCSLGTIPAGGSATLSVAYTVLASTDGGPQTEAVSVTSSVVDPAAADNSATDTTTVVESGPTPTPKPTPTAVSTPPSSPTRSTASGSLPDTAITAPTLGGLGDLILDLTIPMLVGSAALFVVVGWARRTQMSRLPSVTRDVDETR